MRTFIGTFAITIDENEADIDTEVKPASLIDIKNYLASALIIDIDTENEGDPFGFQSCKLFHDSLIEIVGDDDDDDEE